MRFRVRSLASLSGLEIWCCRELWCRSKTQLSSHVAVAVVWAGSCSSDCHGYSPREKKSSKMVKMANFMLCVLLSQLKLKWIKRIFYWPLPAKQRSVSSSCIEHLQDRHPVTPPLPPPPGTASTQGCSSNRVFAKPCPRLYLIVLGVAIHPNEANQHPSHGSLMQTTQ